MRALSLLALVACTPPVLFPARNDEWALESSDYPRDAEVIELERDGAPTLRGLYVPADADAPLVVHFAESGGSITGAEFSRTQYLELAEVGFASLAIDYRGIGLSNGKTSPQRLADDARAMYDHALTRVEGDERRIVMRGTSIGALAIASLLESGARPAAVVLFAPVLADSVAINYGYATLWNPIVWILRPFLRSFLDADLLEELARIEAPLLVFADERDELLSGREHARLVAAVERAGGRLLIPDNLISYSIPGLELSEQFERHIAIASASFHVTDEEHGFLRETFDDAALLELRLAQVLEHGDEALVARVLADAAATEHLHELVLRTRSTEPNFLLATALHKLDPNIAHRLYQYGDTQSTKHPYVGRSAAELEALLDHSDPAGPLPPIATLLARYLLKGTWSDGDTPHRADWPIERVLELARALTGEPAGEFSLDPETKVLTMLRTPGGEEHRVTPIALLAALERRDRAPTLDDRRRVARVLFKALGHVEHVAVENPRALIVEGAGGPTSTPNF